MREIAAGSRLFQRRLPFINAVPAKPLCSTLFLKTAAELAEEAASQFTGSPEGSQFQREPPPPPPRPPELLPDRRLLLPALAQLTALQELRLASAAGRLSQAVPSAWLSPGAFPVLRQ
jgi:hypothetical protein